MLAIHTNTCLAVFLLIFLKQKYTKTGVEIVLFFPSYRFNWHQLTHARFFSIICLFCNTLLGEIDLKHTVNQSITETHKVSHFRESNLLPVENMDISLLDFIIFSSANPCEKNKPP